MRDYIDIGPTPPEEECEQVGANYNDEKAVDECKRYIALLRKVFGPEPTGAQLVIKSFPHEFGSYREVVCYYDDNYHDSVTYAFACESSGPFKWTDETPRDYKKESPVHGA